MNGNDDLPVMRLHRGDYLRVTLGWPPTARLAYVELLGAQWDRGELPGDPAQLRWLVAGVSEEEWLSIWPLIEAHLPCDPDGCRRNLALELDRARTLDMIGARRRGGRAGAAKRWGAAHDGLVNDSANSSANASANGSVNGSANAEPIAARARARARPRAQKIPPAAAPEAGELKNIPPSLRAGARSSPLPKRPRS